MTLWRESLVRTIYCNPPDRGKVEPTKGEAQPAPTGQASGEMSMAPTALTS